MGGGEGRGGGEGERRGSGEWIEENKNERTNLAWDCGASVDLGPSLNFLAYLGEWDGL